MISIKEKKRVIKNKAAFFEGLTAFKTGVKEEHCPYSYLSDKYFDWMKGYCYALKRKKGEIKCLDF